MTCQVCSGRAHNAYLCPPCTQDLRAMLREFITGPHNSPGLLEDLADTATGHTRFNDPTGPHTGRPDSRTPRLNPTASALQARTHTQLRTITARIVGTDTDHSSIELAIWLAAHTHTIANHHTAGETFTEIHALHHRILAIIDRPEPSQPAGHCDCGTTLRARVSATEIVCPNCGIILDINERQRQLLGELVNQGRAFTRDEFPVVLSMLGMPHSARSLRRWRHNGQLPITGYTHDGEPLYRPIDLPKISRVC